MKRAGHLLQCMQMDAERGGAQSMRIEELPDPQLSEMNRLAHRVAEAALRQRAEFVVSDYSLSYRGTSVAWKDLDRALSAYQAARAALARETELSPSEEEEEGVG